MTQQELPKLAWGLQGASSAGIPGGPQGAVPSSETCSVLWESQRRERGLLLGLQAAWCWRVRALPPLCGGCITEKGRRPFESSEVRTECSQVQEGQEILCEKTGP